MLHVELGSDRAPDPVPALAAQGWSGIPSVDTWSCGDPHTEPGSSGVQGWKMKSLRVQDILSSDDTASAPTSSFS